MAKKVVIKENFGEFNDIEVDRSTKNEIKYTLLNKETRAESNVIVRDAGKKSFHLEIEGELKKPWTVEIILTQTERGRDFRLTHK